MSGDVEAAWEALADALDAVNSRSFGMRFIVDAERPAIEAAIRAEAGGLDVRQRELLQDAVNAAAHAGLYLPALVHEFGLIDPWNPTARVAEAATPAEDSDPYCEICPHAMFLHSPDGSCGCGINCEAERVAAADLERAATSTEAERPFEPRGDFETER